MDAYITDPDHSPSKWQETLHGREKDEAIIIVEQDKWAADQLPDGEGYKQSTINAAQRWYYRTSKQTGNSWEVILDENGNEVPNPCMGQTDPPTGDPRNRTFAFTRGTGSLVYEGQKAKLTMDWTELPPAP